MRKDLAVAVILLFMGLAVAPSINANMSKEALVEFTIEVCGLDSKKQTVKLTQEEAEEVESLFYSIREKLNTTESIKGVEEVFKEVVVELDKYGLLGGFSVKQAQRLVTGEFQNPIGKEIVNRLFQKGILKLDEDENMFCLITGGTDGTIFEGYLSRIFGKLNPFGVGSSLIGNWIDEKNPIAIGHSIGLGVKQVFWNLSEDATGWVHTNGLNGVKYWNGSIRGNLSLSFRKFWGNYKDGDSFRLYGTYGIHQGVRGFRGIKFYPDTNNLLNIHYLGFATRVKISPEPYDI